MTAAAAAKTAKSTGKKTATTKRTVAKPTSVAASETKPAAPTTNPEIAKPTTSGKPAPTAEVAAFIETLTTPEERRFAAKQWRHAAGHRSSTPSLRGVSPERAQVIKEGIAAAIA